MRLEEILFSERLKFFVEGNSVRLGHQSYLRVVVAHELHVIETFLSKEGVAAGDEDDANVFINRSAKFVIPRGNHCVSRLVAEGAPHAAITTFRVASVRYSDSQQTFIKLGLAFGVTRQNFRQDLFNFRAITFFAQTKFFKVQQRIHIGGLNVGILLKIICG